MDNIVNAEPPKNSPTIGEEFIDWAERYWHLDKAYDSMGSDGETQHWKSTREIFSKKIDNLISERIETQC